METHSHFLLACLLGILHHERPGFLSKPSSHLVPYLRDRKYPKQLFPAMYEPRDVFTRLTAKVSRAYKRPVNNLPKRRVVVAGDARTFPRVRKIQAVITSPPYMNELEYVRDNRLRLWFLLRSLPTGLDLVHQNRLEAFHKLLATFADVLRETSSKVAASFLSLATPPEAEVAQGARVKLRRRCLRRKND